MKLVAFTDGASRGNPGDAGIGFILKDETGNTVLSRGKFLGTATNNAAEYTALLECIQSVDQSSALNCTELIVHTDSELMARQINGEYRVKDPGLKELYHRVRTMLDAAPFTFSIRHIPRSQNSEADHLANEAIDHKQ